MANTALRSAGEKVRWFEKARDFHGQLLLSCRVVTWWEIFPRYSCLVYVRLDTDPFVWDFRRAWRTCVLTQTFSWDFTRAW